MANFTARIRDCNYDRDTGFGDFNRGNREMSPALKKPRFGNFRD